MSVESTELKGSIELTQPKIERKHFNGFDLVRYTPEHPTSLIPVVIAPGYRSGADSYKLLAKVLCSQGFIVVCTDYNPKSPGQPKKWGMADVNKVDQQAIRTAVKTEGYINKQGIRQVHFYGHSLGSLNGVMVAKDIPESFLSCVLNSPAGIREDMNEAKAIFTLMRGSKRNEDSKKQLVKEHPELAKKVSELKEEKFRKHNFRYFLQAITTASTTIHQYFEGIREKGTKIIIIAESDDGFYPQELYRSILEEAKVAVDGFVVVRGIHSEIRYTPDLCRFICDILRTIEKRIEDQKTVNR